MNYLARMNRTVDIVDQHLKGQRVGFLLGAGSSFLGGEEFPLASDFWTLIQDDLTNSEKASIQEKLDQGARDLEHALDLLDSGDPHDLPMRHNVAKIIGDKFRNIRPPIEIHRKFVNAISKRREYAVPIFSLNYDPLLEIASDYEEVYLFDGFVGYEYAFFHSIAFQQIVGIPTFHKGRPSIEKVRGVIYLYKLHGSLGWFKSSDSKPRRYPFYQSPPDDVVPLMIPPQYRKAQDTGTPPYSNIWSEFRAKLIHGPNLVNRLFTLGYGMRDEHVNAVIETALGRTDFTLIILTKNLDAEVFSRWSRKQKVIIVTEDKVSIYGNAYESTEDLWSFESFVERMI